MPERDDVRHLSPASTSAVGGLSVDDVVAMVISRFQQYGTLTGPPGEPGPPGPATSSDSMSIEVVAGQTLSGHRLIAPANDEGEVLYADCELLADAHGPIWMTTGAIAIGETGDALIFGTHTEPSWDWTAGDPIFLGVDGLMTQTPPASAFLLEVAIAVTPDTVFYYPKVPIVLT